MSTTWNLDPAHSEIQFKVRHMVISTVTGHFNRFEAKAETSSDNLEGATIHFSADAGSVSTGQEARDGHLKGNDFFNAEKFPKISFESTSFKQVKKDHFSLQGNLTIRDVTKPVEFAVEYGGTVRDPYGNDRAGFSLESKINRKDFHLTWNGLLESGGAVASDEVRLIANVEFVRPVKS